MEELRKGKHYPIAEGEVLPRMARPRVCAAALFLGQHRRPIPSDWYLDVNGEARQAGDRNVGVVPIVYLLHGGDCDC